METQRSEMKLPETKLPQTMRALVLTAYNHLELQQVERPRPGRGELLVRVAACGICGSDVHGLNGSTGRRLPPLIMGHEAAGTVAAVGAEVTGFAVGERVTFDSTVWCGECSYCRRGRVNLCERRQVLGVACAEFRRAGAFAEYVVVPERTALPLPQALPFTSAAMLEAVAVAVHAVGRAGIAATDSVLVVGCGMIGLLVVRLARLSGAARLIAVDPDQSRRERALQLGADATLPPPAADDADALRLFVGQVRELAGADGVDKAIEAVGASAPLTAALAALRKGGALTLVGNVSPQVTLPLQQIVSREITLYGSCASNQDFAAAIDLLATRRLDVAPLISAVAPLAAGPDWFRRLAAGEPGLMKVVLEP